MLDNDVAQNMVSENVGELQQIEISFVIRTYTVLALFFTGLIFHEW